MHDSGQDEAVRRVYANDIVMRKIIGNVEQFKDRNSLELASHRFRQLCLKTPIVRREKYAIRLEQDPNWKPILTLLMRPRKFASRLSVVTCSDVPKDESEVLVTYSYQDCDPHKSEIFYEGVRKRLLNQICEFEIKFRRFSSDALENVQRFPKLNRIIVNNAHNISADIDQGEDENIVALDRINSLDLTLDQHFCMELARMRLLIKSNLKHFCCYVNPRRTMASWFVEELMVEMAVQNVQLETCRLVFPDQLFPRNLLVALTTFMSERSRIMQVFFASDLVDLKSMKNTIPAVGLRFLDEKDNTMKLLHDSCPTIFQKANLVHITNMHQENCDQLFDILPSLWAVREIYISRTSQKEETCTIDKLLASLSPTVKTLSVNGCNMDSSSLDLLISSGSKTVKNLCLAENASCNTVPNMVKILECMPELKKLEIDMIVPHLLYPKIAEHRKLEKFSGYTNRFPPEKSLQILQKRFNNVELKKVNSQKQYLVVSDPIRSQM